MDRPIRFAHTADLHLDGPITDLGGAAQAGTRRRDLETAFRRIVEDTATEGMDVLFIAGDFLEHSTVRKQTVEWAKSLLGGLQCPVFIAPGNHDPVIPGSYYETTWPPNVHIFRRQELVEVPVDSLGLVVHGLGWEQSSYRASLLEGFSVPEDGRRHVVVVHGDALNIAETEYMPLDPAALIATGADYVALGHLHNHRVYEERGKAFAAYPGAPEPLRFKESGPHGYLQGVLGEGVELTFIPVARRQFHTLEVDATGCHHDETVEERILTATAAERRDRDLFRIRLTGVLDPEFELHAHAIRERLQGAYYYFELGDQTRRDYDLEALAKGAPGSLETMFVQRLLEQINAAGGAEQKSLYRQALDYGLQALDYGKVTVP